MIALIKFDTGDSQTYSYFTDIEGLNKGDLVVVPTNSNYSLGIFEKYSKAAIHKRQAKKWIIQAVDLEGYNTKLELGIYEEIE